MKKTSERKNAFLVTSDYTSEALKEWLDYFSASGCKQIIMNNQQLLEQLYEGDVMCQHFSGHVLKQQFAAVRNLPITPTDLQELEKILLEQAAYDKELVDRAQHDAGGLGLFVRSLISLERTSVVEAMAEFLNDKNATASQIAFIKMVVECLTKNGAMTNDLLYEQPFTNIAPTGPEELFSSAKLKQLDEAIDAIRHRAIA